MTKPVISVEHLTKQYDLGVIGTGTLSRDLNRWWARLRKQPDPYTRIGQKDAFERIGETILALDDVSFQVQQGEALGIIGRNGAGKSTLLKILSRVTAPTSGVVKVKGRIGSLLEVGTGFHPELTGRENVYLNGAILGMKKAEVARKFDEIVDFSGVEKFIDTPVKRYSSGMYVRLAFAVAAHLDPEILIVDEVLAVGDAEFQKKCLGKMGDVAGEGRTVLFVSHNMGAITTLCSRTLLISNGQISEDGNTDEVIRRYLVNRIESNGLLNFENEKPSGKKVYINKITLKDDRDMITSQFSMGEKASFEFEITANEIVSQLSICFYIKTATGIPVIHTFNQDAGVQFKNVIGNKKIRVDITEMLLYPGDYSLSLWIGDLIGNGFDHKKDCLSFQVIESKRTHRRNLSWNYGLFMCKAHWQEIS